MGSEQNVLSGNKVGSHVESIGTYSLVLDNGYVLDLEMTFYIPSASSLFGCRILFPSIGISIVILWKSTGHLHREWSDFVDQYELFSTKGVI